MTEMNYGQGIISQDVYDELLKAPPDVPVVKTEVVAADTLRKADVIVHKLHGAGIRTLGGSAINP